MKTFLCELILSCLLAGPAAKPIDELTYGTALFAYYQEDYEQALVNVLVAEHQQRRGEDPVRFELAKGSFAFQRGMYRYATATFDTVAASELTDLDRMRLAFHTAREHYRVGRYATMETELAQVDLGANWLGRQRRHPEVTFMRAEGALAREDFAAADAALQALPAGDRYLAYGLFNLGVAHRQAGNVEASHAAFERLARLEVDDQEAWDLVQRGRLALAVMARQTGDAVDARALLGTLPGAGRYRDLALASYGNLAMEQGDYQLAGRIWLTLLKQDGWSSGHAAAQLGLPVSLEHLATPAHALDRYRDAERVFERRLASLGQAARRAQDPAWVDGLLDAYSESDETIRRQALGRMDEGLGEETWLSWLASEDVHQVLVEWRELSEMAGWLARLPVRIEAYEQVTAERRRRSAEAATLLDEGALLERRAEVDRQVETLQADLDTLTREPARLDADWMLRLATDQERALITKLQGMAALVATQMPERDRARFEPRIQRLLGATFWEIADSRSARLRGLARDLEQSRALLAEVDGRIERLARAESQFAAGVETDFLLLAQRATDTSLRVARALDDRRRVIAEALERGLEREVAQTRQYLLTARIAIARATDQLADASAAPGGDS